MEHSIAILRTGLFLNSTLLSMEIRKLSSTATVLTTFHNCAVFAKREKPLISIGLEGGKSLE